MSADASWVAAMPERYDVCLGPALFAPYAAHVAELARTWRPARVLEVAAGTGIGTAALVAALPEAEVLATDLNEAMVALGAERVSAATWRTADAQALDV
ncbi:MAG TPA: class I SAM-dependent methyltransferase, partial [Mycobacteriales bacterium]|nr:class I SAM-dependent methyltransferase [Mycobacteriales bacterium]